MNMKEVLKMVTIVVNMPLYLMCEHCSAFNRFYFLSFAATSSGSVIPTDFSTYAFRFWSNMDWLAFDRIFCARSSNSCHSICTASSSLTVANYLIKLENQIGNFNRNKLIEIQISLSMNMVANLLFHLHFDWIILESI